MVLRLSDEEGGVSSVAVDLGGLVPLVVGEVRLGKRDEYPHVVGGSQDLLERRMHSRRGAIVMCENQIDSHFLVDQQVITCALVSGFIDPSICVLEGCDGTVDACAVQIEIATLDVELPEAEPHRFELVTHVPVGVGQDELQVILIGGCVQVPELLGLPRSGEPVATILHPGGGEGPAGERRDLLAVIKNAGTEFVTGAGLELQGGVKSNRPISHGRVDLDLVDTSSFGGAHQEHVTREPAP